MWTSRVGQFVVEQMETNIIVFFGCNRENIGFDIRGDIKIFDFGMARDLSTAEPDGDGMFKLSHMTGSLRYMSPEVALGRPYNETCDVYSFAILLWEVLSLDRAYDDLTNEGAFVTEVFKKGARPPVKQKWSDIVKELLHGAWDENAIYRLPISIVKTKLRKEIGRLQGNESGLEHRFSRRRSTFVFQPTKKQGNDRSLRLSNKTV
jgi:serine/threonine protein kinase